MEIKKCRVGKRVRGCGSAKGGKVGKPKEEKKDRGYRGEGSGGPVPKNIDHMQIKVITERTKKRRLLACAKRGGGG